MQIFSENEVIDIMNRDYPDEFRGRRVVLGEGDENPDVVIIRDYPSYEEVRAGRPFIGKDGLAVRKGLVSSGYKFYATIAYPFPVPSGKLAINEGRKTGSVISEELRRLGAKKVMLFGVQTARLVPSFSAPFKRMNDILHRNIEIGDVTYRVVQHPMQIAGSPNMYRQFLQGLQELLDPGSIKRPVAPRSENYYVHHDPDLARKVLKAMPERVACDLETTGLDPYTGRILTIQFSWKEGIGHSIPWDLLPPDEWAAALSSKKLIFQNGTFDVKFLATHGVFVRIAEDTMLMHSFLDETPGTHSMELMAQRYLGIDKWSDTVDYDNMELEDLDNLGRYGARDVDITLRLANYFAPYVKGRPINTILHDAQNSITRSELRGIKIDRERALEMQLEIGKHLANLTEEIQSVHDIENPGSPQQVAKVLYEDLGLPVQKKKGKVTTNEDAMHELSQYHDLPNQILTYRHLVKASGTYINKLLEVSSNDGRYHPDFRLAATETGRLAESLIMLIPRPDDVEDADIGKQYQYKIRELFIPDEGRLMIGADYSGLEVAMAAYLTSDSQLIKDVQNKLDTHSVVAIQAFDLDIPLEPYDTLKKRVSENHSYFRTLAKSGTFTWLYGGGESAIASNLGIDLSLARKILAALRNRYRGVAEWQDGVREEVQRTGSISTPWGRTRRFLFHRGLPQKVIEEQLRESINMPNQGMSSDITLYAFSQLERMGLETLFPFHDATYLQAEEGQVKRVAETVRSVMENVLPGVVPFRADVKWGANLGALG